MVTYWTDKNVSLLGGASLIGTHLARALTRAGAEVRIADDLSSGLYSNIPYGAEFKRMDLRNFAAAKMAVHDADIVFHLAAQHGGRGYVAGHKVELYDNLSLDTNIFRACAEEKVEKVIFSSSACAYPIGIQNNTDELLFLHEELIDYDNLQPADGAYGTEKLVGEAMLDAYIEAGAFKGCSTRSFTVYGPLMKENHAIAALIAKVLIRQEPLEIWGDGKQIRNWTFVDDNVAGAMLAAEHLERGAINIGVEDRLTPLEALGDICDIMKWHPKEVKLMPDKPVGPRNRVANSGKLTELGWRPQVSFEEGLKRTIDWYLEMHDVEEVKEGFERKLTER